MTATKSSRPTPRPEKKPQGLSSKIREAPSHTPVLRRSNHKKNSSSSFDRTTATLSEDKVLVANDHVQQFDDTPRYKDDTDAFTAPPEEGPDFISAIPGEILDHIISFCLQDHDPERGAKEKAKADGGKVFKEEPHVLIALSAMSKHFRDHVEGFSRRLLLKNKQVFHFKTNEERKNQELKKNQERRRSERIKAQPAKPDTRVYRMEVVRHLHIHCISCNEINFRRGAMINKVSLCNACEHRDFPAQLNLTEARQFYDLRDWMLIATRHPGPRAKKKAVQLPTIPYGTVRTGSPLMNGKTLTSYRFYTKDVERIANLVHGDFQKHMRQKREQRVQKIHRKLKIRKHTDRLKSEKHRGCKKYHRKRLDEFQASDWDETYDSDASTYSGYGKYGDIHEQFCNRIYCQRCMDKKMVKYTPWFDEDLIDPGDYSSDLVDPWSDGEDPFCG